MSYPYASGPPSGNIYQRSSSIINETESGPIRDPAPSRSDVGLRNNEETQAEGRRRNLDGEAYHGQGQDRGPSLTDMQHHVGNSIPGNGSLYGSGYGYRAPDVDGHVRFNISNTSQDSSFTQEEKSPGLSGQVHKNQSKTGGPSSVADAPNPPLNQADYVGISLVGRRFKQVNPTAYYVEKNDTGF